MICVCVYTFEKGDQASILGGAINFVKELEQLLQSMEAQKGIKQRLDNSLSSGLFSGFFTLPQYTCSNESSESMMEKRSAIADIEVTMVESYANIKILSRKHPKQLLKMVAALQSLHLIVLHLNVTTVDNMVLYSFSVKVSLRRFFFFFFFFFGERWRFKPRFSLWKNSMIPNEV